MECISKFVAISIHVFFVSRFQLIYQQEIFIISGYKFMKSFGTSLKYFYEENLFFKEFPHPEKFQIFVCERYFLEYGQTTYDSHISCQWVRWAVQNGKSRMTSSSTDPKTAVHENKISFVWIFIYTCTFLQQLVHFTMFNKNDHYHDFTQNCLI